MTAYKTCPCRSDSNSSSDGSSQSEEVQCSSCVQESLQELIERRRQALEERNKRRKWCEKRLNELNEDGEKQISDQIHDAKNNNSPNSSSLNSTKVPQAAIPTSNDELKPAKLKSESDRLRHKLSTLVHLCNSTGLNRDRLVLSNEIRKSELQTQAHTLQSARDAIHALYKEPSVGVISTLEHTWEDAIVYNRRMRFQLALQVFDMHRIDAGSEYKNNKKHKRAEGIGKIGGLPLPHAGSVLYGALPPGVLTSALRLVASLTCTLARVLGIMLPHPILLQPHSNGDNAAAADDNDIVSMSVFQFSMEDEDGTSFRSTHASMDQSGTVAADQSVYLERMEQSNLEHNSCSSYSTAPNVNLNHSLRTNQPQQRKGATSHGISISTPRTSNDVTIPRPVVSPQSSWSLRRIPGLGGAAAVISRANKAITGGGSSSKSHAAIHSSKLSHLSSGHHNLTASHANNNAQLYRKQHQPSNKHEMDRTSIHERIQHASAAILREEHDDNNTPNNNDANNHTTQFELNQHPNNNNEDFNVGLQLLQNNVVALCIHAGVPVEGLWPAEAILLNLNSLWEYCRTMVSNL